MPDLGTYHVKVFLNDGRGFLEKWDTGGWYGGGSGDIAPLNARRFCSPYSDEADLIYRIVYQFTEGSSSCECSLKGQLDKAARCYDSQRSYGCGDDLRVQKLILVRPDSSEIKIFDRKDKQWENL